MTNRFGREQNPAVASTVVDEVIAQMSRHVLSEKAVLERYRNLARATTRDDVRYLLTMIAEEEERHHARMAQIVNAYPARLSWRDLRARRPRFQCPAAAVRPR